MFHFSWPNSHSVFVFNMQLSTKKAPTGIVTQRTDCCGVKGLPVAHSVVKAMHYYLVSQLIDGVSTFLICHGYSTIHITPNFFLPLPFIQVLLQGAGVYINVFLFSSILLTVCDFWPVDPCAML